MFQGGRVAVVGWRGSGRLLDAVESKVPGLRREPFYFGAAYALWGQIP